jgi:glycosyltransferase involved in cell wall biosynthesis
MKKILYITEQFPYPPDSGGKIKTLNTLNTLSKKFQVHLVSFSPQQITAKNQNFLKKKVASLTLIVDKTINHHVKRNKYKLIKNYLKGIPYLIFQYQNQQAAQKIDQLIKKIAPDVIHIDHLNMAQYLPQTKNCIWIFEEHNLESDLLWSRFIHTKHLKTKFFLFLESLITKIYEYRLLPKFDAVITISFRDAEILKKQFPNINIFTYLLPIEKLKIKKQIKLGSILFLGDLTWHPNQDAIEWFVSEIFPLVKKSNPNSTLDSVGIKNNNLEQHQLLDIEYHGYKKNITNFFKSAHVFVLPFRIGEGIRIKVLTALSAGIPIVSTATGVKGLNLTSNKEFLLANTPKEFAKKINTLTKNKQKRKNIINAGFKYLEKYHQQNNNLSFLKKYQKITQ